MLPFGLSRMIRRLEYLLHSLIEIACDERLVLPLLQMARPVEVAAVHRILQDLMDLGLHERLARGPVRETRSGGLFRDRLERQPT